jgi:uncharacterized protein (DUF433 family)
MLDTTQTISQLINRDPEIMSGTPVFMGTRVPIKTLFDHLRGDYTLDGFLEQFPSVRREQAIAVLESCRDILVVAVQ